MKKYEHLKLPLYQENIDRKKNGGGGYSLPEGRNKSTFSGQAVHKADEISSSFAVLKRKFSGRIKPSLIYEIEINQSVSPEIFEKNLLSMGIHVLSVAEGKKGYWVVFSNDDGLNEFKKRLSTYGSQKGPKYDFFNAIESFQDIPKEKKIGQSLTEKPLVDTADFIDIELWKYTDPRKNEKFIRELKEAYPDFSEFRITDTLTTKSFVLLRVKLTKAIFDEIIELKEIARADRPLIPQFNPFEYMHPDISGFEFNEPPENATGILVIDSGIISNHPMLENCVGAEENYQSGEKELQDTVGHGTAVAGCAVYGDIEKSLKSGNFTPDNWVFSAKVMYAEKNEFNGEIRAVYDPDKLIEHQFKDAVESFLSNAEYHIKVVNISLGNNNEVWGKHYSRQLPLASLIDELAMTFPHVVFIVSAGNQNPLEFYDSIQKIKEHYPFYLIENENFRIINPATSALALTVGSIADEVRIGEERFGSEEIKTPIADFNQPSPFTRTGAGINGMVKPELVEYGGNLILSEKYKRITKDVGGKIALLNNKTDEDIIRYDYGTSFSAPKVARLAGKIANMFPQRSANFIKNMLLAGSDYPFTPDNDYFYASVPSQIGAVSFQKLINKLSDDDKAVIRSAFDEVKLEKKTKYCLKSGLDYDSRRIISDIIKEAKYKTNLASTNHLAVCGYGLCNFDRAVSSYNNRTVLWDENRIGLNQIKVYSLQLPNIFFFEKGKKKISVILTFNPETRSTRGDSYLGNRMEFHVFHSINPQILIEKYGVIDEITEQTGVPENLQKYEIKFLPGSSIRKNGCHQKAWKEYKREPKDRPEPPVSLVLLNFNKWITDDFRMQDYCISVIFEHEKDIDLYNAIRTNVQARVRFR